jgi:peroxiredoxin
MKGARYFIGVTLLCLLIILWSFGYAEEKVPYPLSGLERQAVDFSLKDLNGRTVSLKDYKGRNVLLVFTTTWCPYCKREIPDLKKMHEAYRGKLDILAVYINESQKKVEAFVKDYKIPYTVLLDPKAEVARAYGVFGVPTKVLVGKDSKIYCFMCRSLDVMLEKLIGK